MPAGIWTPTTVADALEEAAQTLRRLPPAEREAVSVLGRR
jgi:hypothetical protein